MARPEPCHSKSDLSLNLSAWVSPRATAFWRFLPKLGPMPYAHFSCSCGGTLRNFAQHVTHFLHGRARFLPKVEASRSRHHECDDKAGARGGRWRMTRRKTVAGDDGVEHRSPP